MTYRELMDEIHTANAVVDTRLLLAGGSEREAVARFKENVSIMNTMIYILALKDGADNLDATIDDALRYAIKCHERADAKYGKKAAA